MRREPPSKAPRAKICHYCTEPATADTWIVPQIMIDPAYDDTRRSVLTQVRTCEDCKRFKGDRRALCSCPVCETAWLTWILKHTPAAYDAIPAVRLPAPIRRLTPDTPYVTVWPTPDPQPAIDAARREAEVRRTERRRRQRENSDLLTFTAPRAPREFPPTPRTNARLHASPTPQQPPQQPPPPERWCHYCERLATTRDHIVPKSLMTQQDKGADWRLANTVPACQPCNSAKSSKRSSCGCGKCTAAWEAWSATRPLATMDWIDNDIWSPR